LEKKASWFPGRICSLQEKGTGGWFCAETLQICQRILILGTISQVSIF
jgi:hypothetical protein